MRQQYHFRPTENGVFVWDVLRLIELAKDLPVRQIPLCDIRELDESFWFDNNDEQPTCRRIAMHAKLIAEADLRHPIILSRDGRVMDGMHRVCKALIQEQECIAAVQFARDPDPDYTDVGPNDLPY